MQPCIQTCENRNSVAELLDFFTVHFRRIIKVGAGKYCILFKHNALYHAIGAMCVSHIQRLFELIVFHFSIFVLM